MQGITYVKLVAGAVPRCGRCGGPVAAVGENIFMAVAGIVTCAGCTSPAEDLAQGERLVAGLRREANALRMQLKLAVGIASGEELTYEMISEIVTSETARSPRSGPNSSA